MPTPNRTVSSRANRELRIICETNPIPLVPPPVFAGGILGPGHATPHHTTPRHAKRAQSWSVGPSSRCCGRIQAADERRSTRIENKNLIGVNRCSSAAQNVFPGFSKPARDNGAAQVYQTNPIPTLPPPVFAGGILGLGHAAHAAQCETDPIPVSGAIL